MSPPAAAAPPAPEPPPHPAITLACTEGNEIGVSTVPAGRIARGFTEAGADPGAPGKGPVTTRVR
ncbi:MAG TPA: hypothetical protein VLS89_20760, partial [Candidatus Nanopelagicales bacterium]|nr:hypothetical protein [Candidatus Nanopelagicales bacterium]